MTDDAPVIRLDLIGAAALKLLLIAKQMGHTQICHTIDPYLRGGIASGSYDRETQFMLDLFDLSVDEACDRWFPGDEVHDICHQLWPKETA